VTDVSTRPLSAGKLRRNASRSRVWGDSDFKLCDLQVGSGQIMLRTGTGRRALRGLGSADAHRRNLVIERGQVTGPVGRQRPRPGGGKGSARKASVGPICLSSGDGFDPGQSEGGPSGSQIRLVSSGTRVAMPPVESATACAKMVSAEDVVSPAWIPLAH